MDLKHFFLCLTDEHRQEFLDLQHAQDAATRKWIDELRHRTSPRFESAIKNLITKYEKDIGKFVLLTNRYADFLKDGNHNYAKFLKGRQNSLRITIVDIGPGVKINQLSGVYEKTDECLRKLKADGITRIYCNMTGQAGAVSALALLAPAYFDVGQCVFCQAEGDRILEDRLPPEYASLIAKRNLAHISASIIETKILGKSAEIRNVIKKAGRLAQYDCNVLILGPSGTGKSKIARAIHEQSERKSKPFYEINCGGVTTSTLESRLFGHVKGAFTGAVEDRSGIAKEADGGTVFLDEIGDSPREFQDMLMTFLQPRDPSRPTVLHFKKMGTGEEYHTDVRIIAATNKDIRKEIKEGRFREDLYYRLSATTFTMPPLKGRGEDILLLAESILENHNNRNRSTPGYTPKRLTDSAKATICSFDWPGNVRQLENVLTSAIVFSDTEEITQTDLDFGQCHTATDDAQPTLPTPEDFSLEKIKEDLERRYIEMARRVTKSDAEASRLLGMKTSANLVSRIRALNKRVCRTEIHE